MQSFLTELGHEVRRVDEELHLTATITPEMHAPATSHLRTSILALWVDMLGGLLAMEAASPRVVVTLELDVHLYAPAPGDGTVQGIGRTVKAGRSVFVAETEFSRGDGRPFAFGAASFMASPDPTLHFPGSLSIEMPSSEKRLSVPFAERARCEIREPGIAVLPRSEGGVNSSNTVNGGLIALAAEEATLSLHGGTTLCSLDLRYLQPVRTGPVVATAHLENGLGHVRLRETGKGDRLAALATARVF